MQSINGNAGDPFDNVYDALTKAMEVCAQYLSCDVTIYLESTEHGMIRSTYGFLLPSKSDRG